MTTRNSRVVSTCAMEKINKQMRKTNPGQLTIDRHTPMKAASLWRPAPAFWRYDAASVDVIALLTGHKEAVAAVTFFIIAQDRFRG